MEILQNLQKTLHNKFWGRKTLSMILFWEQKSYLVYSFWIPSCPAEQNFSVRRTSTCVFFQYLFDGFNGDFYIEQKFCCRMEVSCFKLRLSEIFDVLMQDQIFAVII